MFGHHGPGHLPEHRKQRMEPSSIRGMRSQTEALLYVILCQSGVHVMVCARSVQLALFRSIFDPAGLRLHGAARHVEHTSISHPMSVLPRMARHQSELPHDSHSGGSRATRLSGRTSAGFTARHSRRTSTGLIGRIVRPGPRTLSLP